MHKAPTVCTSVAELVLYRLEHNGNRCVNEDLRCPGQNYQESIRYPDVFVLGEPNFTARQGEFESIRNLAIII